jgi:two-component system response regulator YesN
VIRDLEENVAERRSLAYYAAKYNYNACYFSQLFKKVTGATFAEYFIQLKISKAQTLISSSNLLLADIASRVGYDDYYHFSKIFKKYTGLTPTEYRASAK